MGMVQGGWGFVIAAYGISWVLWLGYAWTLARQAQRTETSAGREEA